MRNEKLQLVLDLSKDVDDITLKVVNAFCGDLDKYITSVKSKLQDKKYTTKDLEDIIIEIPLLLYFVGDKQELVGVREDISKLVKEEAYNRAILTSEGRVADKTASAEMATQQEAVHHIAYSRAYKIIKSKVEVAYELVNSCKKIISREMEERKLG